jgi:hypothetical protein
VIAMTVTTDNQRVAAVAAAQGRQARPFAAPGVRSLTVGNVRPSAGQPASTPAAAAAPVGTPEHVCPAEPIEAVLAAAEGSVQQKLRTKAARVREQITELSNLVKVEAEARQVEARVQKLRDELAAAETELRTLRHPATTSSSAPASTTTREVAQAVRAWAKTNNIEVSAHGRVPSDLVQRWQDATGGIL